MLNMVVLDPRLSGQLRAREVADIAVVHVERLDDLSSAVLRHKPHVLVLNLELLGDDPTGVVRQWMNVPGVERVLVTYYFTKREYVSNLQSERSRALRAPITLDALRLQLTSLIVKHQLEKNT